MNHKVMCMIVLMGTSLSVGAVAEEPVLTRAGLTATLRAGEPVVGRIVDMKAVYVGVQTDRDGELHHLFTSRDENTLYLCYFAGTERGRMPGEEARFTGRILRVELQDQDLRDHRTYAIWIDVASFEPEEQLNRALHDPTVCERPVAGH